MDQRDFYLRAWQQDAVRKARRAVGVLRDAAREGRHIDFRERDELVIDIHNVIDSFEAMASDSRFQRTGDEPV